MSISTFEDFLAQLGFDSNPFAKTNAAQEERLEQYFIRPKYFTTLQGDPSQPSSSLVFAPRGSGKTAQKIMLERFCTKAEVLPIPYDHFRIPSKPSPQSFSVEYHLENVLRQGLLAIISYMIEQDLDADKLPAQDRRNFSQLSRHYLGTLNVEDVDSFTKSLLGRIDRMRQFWNEWRAFGTAMLAPLLAKVGIDEIPAMPGAKSVLDQDISHHFALYKNICQSLGFRSIYVLVDRIDETEWTGNNPERSYHLIGSLLRNLPLLDDPYVGWKFFVWDRIAEYCREDARPDRVEQFSLEWSRTELSTMLSRRLQAYSNGRLKEFSDLLDADAESNQDWPILFCHQSPRNLIRMCNDIVSEQAERDASSSSISQAALEAGISKFCGYSVLEQYPEDHVRGLRRVGKTSFTISYLGSNVYKEHLNSTRNRVRNWEASGVVYKNGTIKKDAGVKPSNYYMVVDPRLVRYLYERRSISEIIDSKCLPCDRCDRLIFSEFEDREDDVICPHCERVAFI